MLSGYYQESEEKFQNRLVKKCQKLSEEEKDKNCQTLVSITEIFLKKKRK